MILIWLHRIFNAAPSQRLNFIHEWVSVKWEEEGEGVCHVFLSPLKWFLTSYWYRSGTVDYADKLINYLLLTNNTKVLFSWWSSWLQRMSMNLKLFQLLFTRQGPWTWDLPTPHRGTDDTHGGKIVKGHKLEQLEWDGEREECITNWGIITEHLRSWARYSVNIEAPEVMGRRDHV